MKIVLFINTLSSGGAEHQLSYLANFLDDEGHDISIVTFGDLPDHYQLNLTIKRTRLAQAKSKVRKALSIFNYFRKIKCDIVISFCQDNSLLAIPGLLINRKPKLIVGERSTTIGSLTKIERILFNFLYKRAKYIVPNSYTQKAHIIKYAPSLKPKIKVITNYTDTTIFTPKNGPTLNSAKNICVFARYTWQKNYQRFCDTVKILKDKGYKFHIDWFGSTKMPNDKTNADFLAFKKMTSEYHLEDFISLNDSVKNVPDKIKQYDAFCLPSIIEGFSNSLSEAICSGLPVLAGNISDNTTMVKDGINGFVFDPYDVDSMVVAVEKVLNLPPAELKKMGDESVKIANGLFDKNKFIENYLRLIKIG